MPPILWRAPLRVEYCRDQPVDGFRVGDVLQTVFNDAHLNGFPPLSPVRGVEIDTTQVRAIRETLFHVQAKQSVWYAKANPLPSWRPSARVDSQGTDGLPSTTCLYAATLRHLGRALIRSWQTCSFARPTTLCVPLSSNPTNRILGKAPEPRRGPFGPTKSLGVFRRIGHVQGTTIQAHQTPLPIPCPFRILVCNRGHDRLISCFSGSAPSRLRA